MDQFLQHHRVYLTPLTPIHIGCGEDFEPTNYVIDDGVLYHFDPSSLYLSDSQRQELLALAQKADLGAIQKFFQRNKLQTVKFAHYFADVATGLARDWEKRIGKTAQIEGNGQKIFNQFYIERISYSPYSHLPYIPASSFKGALVTALLDSEHQKQGNPKVDLSQKLVENYIGTFQDSLLRTIKFADFQPNSTAFTQILYSTNHKKKISETSKEDKRMILRRECILGGQYRAFSSELTIIRKDKTAKLQNITEYLVQLDQFNRAIFQEEMAILSERSLIDKNVAQTLKQVITQSKAILVRLGKSGAESKSLRGKNVAQIKIMKGGKDGQDDYRDHATTLWLASVNENNKSNLLPFGWALLELDPTNENEALKQWCDSQPKATFDRAKILAEQQAEKAKIAQQKAKEEAKRLAEQQAELEKQALLQSLNANQKSVMDLVEKFQSGREMQIDINSSLLKEVKTLVENAVQNWDSTDKAFIYQQISIDLIKSRVELKKKTAKKDLEKLLNKLLN